MKRRHTTPAEDPLVREQAATYKTGRQNRRVGLDMAAAQAAIAAQKRRSPRLIANVLKQAGTADGPRDLSTNLRRYLYRDQS